MAYGCQLDYNVAKQDITRNQYTDPLLPGNLGNMDYNPYREVRDCGKLIQFLKERGIIQWALLCFNVVQMWCKVVFCNPAP